MQALWKYDIDPPLMVHMDPSSPSCWVCVLFVFQTSQATRQAWEFQEPLDSLPLPYVPAYSVSVAAELH